MHTTGTSRETGAEESSEFKESGRRPLSRTSRPKPRRRHRFWRWLGIILLILIVIGAIGRAILPWAVRDYVNRTLSRSPLYSGKIGEVQIHLWRGAYSIHDVSISKTSGSVPVPFFAAKQLDFALQWKALAHHRVVGRVWMDEPEINFVDAPGDAESQTGAGGAWLQMIRDLFPFKINTALIHNGSVHFRAYQTKKPVDVYLSKVEGSIDNLGNIQSETTPLSATVEAKAMVMDDAKMEFKMTLDPFSYRPTFHMALRLLGLDLTKINDLSLAYGKFDFKRGWMDLVIETDAKEGQLAGYVKPLFRNPKVFKLSEDLKEDNVFQFFWQALVGAVTFVFKNQARDQFGTLIPFTADVSGSTTTDIFATLGNVLRNAFIRAYLPRLEGGSESINGFHFEPPQFTDPISAGDADPE